MLWLYFLLAFRQDSFVRIEIAIIRTVSTKNNTINGRRTTKGVV